jgi:hypothetical protein
MLNKYKYSFCFMVFVINLLLVFNLLLAEEKPSTYKSYIVPYTPAKPSKHYNVSELKAILMRHSIWLAYKAFRNRDVSICDSAKIEGGPSNAPEICFDRVQHFMFLKALASGDCNNIPPSRQNSKELCEAIKNQSCGDSLPAYQKKICEGLLANDKMSVVQAYSEPSFPGYVAGSERQAKVETFVNLYNGFKNNSESACNKFTIPNLLIKASCNMLFGNHNFEKRLDGISQDIIYTLDAKESGDAKSCDNVKDESIKTACKDNSVTDLKDILNLIWN